MNACMDALGKLRDKDMEKRESWKVWSESLHPPFLFVFSQLQLLWFLVVPCWN